MTYKYWREKLGEFKAFEHGWDSYDAKPIQQEAINQAWSILSVLESAGIDAERVFVSPVANGTIDVEVTCGDLTTQQEGRSRHDG